MAKATKRVLIVLAHCDDEIIHGWPVYQDESLTRTLLICGSDENNPNRPQGKRGKRTMLQLAAKNGVGACAFDYDCEFYRLESRKGSLANFCESIANAVRSYNGDYIFTHNPHGEYGHSDHKLIWDIVFNHSKKPIWFTDIFTESNWTHDEAISERARDTIYSNKIRECVADDKLVDDAVATYQRNNCYTWDQKVVKKCNLYQVD